MIEVLDLLAAGGKLFRLSESDVLAIAHGVDVLAARKQEAVDVGKQRLVDADTSAAKGSTTGAPPAAITALT